MRESQKNMLESLIQNIQDKKPLTPDQKMFEELAWLVQTTSATSEQIKQAYYEIVGVADTTSADETVRTLFKKMKQMTEAHFPLTGFVEFIHGRQNKENAVPIFYSYLESAPLSDREKSILKSIVDKRRCGELIYLVGEEPVASIHITKENKGDSAAILLSTITKLSARLKDKKFNIQFSED